MLSAQVSVSLSNNSVELFALDAAHAGESMKLRSIETDGHHSEVRAVGFSSDNLAIVSGSGNQIKMWNRYGTLGQLRTIYHFA